MGQLVENRKEIEARAAALGASTWTIAKWRIRGIPPKWQIKLFGLKDAGDHAAPPTPDNDVDGARP